MSLNKDMKNLKTIEETELTNTEIRYFKIGVKKAIRKFNKMKKIVDAKVSLVEYYTAKTQGIVDNKKVDKFQKLIDKEIKVLEKNVEEIKKIILNSGAVMDITVDDKTVGIDEEGNPIGKEYLDELELNDLLEYAEQVMKEYKVMLSEIKGKN